MVDLTLANNDDEDHDVRVEVLQAEGVSDRNDATMFDQRRTVPPAAANGEAGEVRFEDAFRAVPAIVNVDVRAIPPRHYHFFPDCVDRRGTRDEVRVAIL